MNWNEAHEVSEISKFQFFKRKYSLPSILDLKNETRIKIGLSIVKADSPMIHRDAFGGATEKSE
jgi:hypothetical protein